MTTSYLFWMLVSLMVFWTLGAYNRLVRLRSDWVQALQLLAAQWQAHAVAIQQALPHSSSADAALIDQGVNSGNWLPLVLATRQFQICVANLVAKPQAIPNADDLSSIHTAYEVLHNVWISLKNVGDDLAGSAMPQHLSLIWQQQALLVEEKCTHYNAQVLAYNRAIEQFPARVLAWSFGFEAAYAVYTC
jgi:LemA protein